VRTERSELAEGKREDSHLRPATTLRVVPGAQQGQDFTTNASRRCPRARSTTQDPPSVGAPREHAVVAVAVRRQPSVPEMPSKDSIWMN